MRNLLILLIFILGGVVYLQWQNWPSELNLSPAGAASGGIEEDLNILDPGDFTLPPIEEYQVVVERPLFISGRRPPVPDAVSATKEPVKPTLSNLQIQLIGVVIKPEGQSVLVRDKKTKKTSYLAKGDKINGWTIEQIDPDRLLLTQLGRREELSLRVYPDEPVARSRRTGRIKRKKGSAGKTVESVRRELRATLRNKSKSGS